MKRLDFRLDFRLGYSENVDGVRGGYSKFRIDQDTVRLLLGLGPVGLPITVG